MASSLREGVRRDTGSGAWLTLVSPKFYRRQWHSNEAFFLGFALELKALSQTTLGIDIGGSVSR